MNNNKQTYFRVLPLFILIYLGLNESLSQNLIKNSGFELHNEASGCRGSGGNYNNFPFNSLRIHNWEASHGSAQLNESGCKDNEGIINSGSYATFLSFTDDNKEGIFQYVEFEKDQSYNFNIYAYGSKHSKIIIKMANGLVNESPPKKGGTPNIANPTDEQLVIEEELSGNGWDNIYKYEINLKS